MKTVVRSLWLKPYKNMCLQYTFMVKKHTHAHESHYATHTHSLSMMNTELRRQIHLEESFCDQFCQLFEVAKECV